MADLDAVRGDTNEYDVTVTRKDGAGVEQPVNLTGAAIKFTVKRSLDDTAVVLQKTVGAGVVITNAATGLCRVTLGPNDTKLLPAPRAFHYDVEVTESDGRVTTVAIGLLRLDADVAS